jgi:hypothetical protein
MPADKPKRTPHLRGFDLPLTEKDEAGCRSVVAALRKGEDDCDNAQRSDAFRTLEIQVREELLGEEIPC